MTEKRFKDIEVGIDGNIRLYSDDINYNTYSQEEIIDLLNEQDQEIQRLKKDLDNSVFVNYDGEDGCYNCNHEIGGFCEIFENPVPSWLNGVSKCNLKHWRKWE